MVPYSVYWGDNTGDTEDIKFCMVPILVVLRVLEKFGLTVLVVLKYGVSGADEVLGVINTCG